MERIVRLDALVDREQAVARRGRVGDDQLPAVGVARDELAVVQPLRDQLVVERKQQRAVRARADRHPLVGDRRVAGAHRVHRDEAPAVALELRDGDLQRVGVMVLGGAEHDEQLRALEVRAAELPERAADRVDEPGRHVHRAETPVRGVVGRAELARKEAGERLHLVAPGEQGELLRVRRADRGEPLLQHGERLVPGDRLELARAALGAGLAPQRARQARGRLLLHDAARALGADHALVERVRRVAFDVAHVAVAHVHADAAAARAHVAGGGLHFGGHAASLSGRFRESGNARILMPV